MYWEERYTNKCELNMYWEERYTNKCELNWTIKRIQVLGGFSFMAHLQHWITVDLVCCSLPLISQSQSQNRYVKTIIF